ncbi:unnamed protein product [Bursaphelenchus okinawaensis]|uniref:Integrase catalytic domain-containing protein n=1 Tax=Bursaphelenchus okinawaensis TaxID=465554 RepID=A0A811KJI7_9BILA|nr:unnamed protein product [Bursaphelenchus okinawaensis]CAG9105921.1 unnamed protein product [Bursaphelenchus okinawaensis]
MSYRSSTGAYRKILGPGLATANKLVAKYKDFNIEINSAETNLENQIRIQGILIEVEALQKSTEKKLTQLSGINQEWRDQIKILPQEDHVEEDKIFIDFDDKTSMTATIEQLDTCLTNLDAYLRTAKHLLDSLARTDTPVVVQQQTPEYFQLAKLKLPRFNGKGDWREFESIFEESVVKNPSMSKATKFRYLADALTDEARMLIVPAFPQSGENFDAAYAALKERYGTEEAQKRHLVEELLSMKKPNDTNSEVKNFLQSVESLCLRMEAIHVDPNKLETRCAVERILPGRLKKEVMKAKIMADHWDTNELRKTLKLLLRLELELNDSKDKTSQRSTLTTQSKGSFNKFDCLFCGSDDHKTSWCKKCKTPKQRQQRVRDLKRCLGCFKSIKHNCGATCKICHKKGHHYILCYNNKIYEGQNKQKQNNWNKSPRKNKQTNFTDNESGEDESERTAIFAQNMSLATLLPTLRIKISDPKNKKGSAIVNCLIDSCADDSYITKRLAKQISVMTTDKTTLITSTFGGRKSEEKAEEATVTLESLVSKDKLTTKVIVVKEISGQVKRMKQINSVQKIEKVQIDALLGANIFAKICNLPKNKYGFASLKTTFGTAVLGTGSTQKESDESCKFSFVTQAEKTNEELKKIWSFEAIAIDGSDYGLKVEDEVFKRFLETLKFEQGRYQARWPWKIPRQFVAESRKLALGRLNSLYNKQKGSKLWDEYDNIIKDQIEKDIIEEVTEEKASDGNCVHYLPHLAVERPEHSSTKIRIVFDASAGKYSLNDAMEKGPMLVPLLMGILLRVRTGKYLLAGDLEKAFLAIELQKEARDTTRFLWLKNPNLPPSPENLRVFRFKRIVFGNRSSPSVLAMTLKHLVTEKAPSFIQKELDENTYVDNTNVQAETAERLFEKYEAQEELFESASMKIGKFATNCEAVKKKIPKEEQEEKETVSMLGLLWNTVEDTLEVKIPKVPTIYTKREVLSRLHGIFDPMGFVCPALLPLKQLLQQLWLKNLDWDEELPIEMKDLYDQFRQSWANSEAVKVQRHVRIEEQNILHGFSDASTKAYGCAMYLNGKLILAKTRVYPTKMKVLVPKGELCGLLINVRALKFIKTQLNIQNCKMIAWTDSTAALGWVLAEEDSKDVFVRNRVREIKQIQKECEIEIRHVPGELNVADKASRGCSINELMNDKSWWNGPEFIHDSEENWPKNPQEVKVIDDLNEEKPRVIVQTFLTVKDEMEPEVVDCIRKSTDWKNALSNLSKDCQKSQAEATKLLIKCGQIEDGLDFASPFILKGSKEGDEKKVYILLFTCLVTRMIHLELTEDITSKNALNALIRFVNRRTKPKVLLSDNGTQLKAVFKAFPQWFNDEAIKWKFIPESAPAFGGVYERCVGITKKALTKMTGHSRMSAEDWRTTITEVEAIVNSRPLLYSSKEPQKTIRPIDFLLPDVVLGLPQLEDMEEENPEDEDYLPIKLKKDKLVDAYRAKVARINEFWKAYQTLYFDMLREKSRWHHKGKGIEKEPKLHEKVLIHEENKK